jgi:hypothetical protein
MLAAYPGEYYLRVRAAYINPVEAEQACCISAAGWSFAVHIFMHDDTAAFLAHLIGDNARLIFKDCVPEDMSKNPVSARKLQMKMDAIRASSQLCVKIAKNTEFASKEHYTILQMYIEK